MTLIIKREKVCAVRPYLLLVFIYHRKEMKEILWDAANSTSIKLQEVWRTENIPVKTEDNIPAGIQKLYKVCQNQGEDKSKTRIKQM